MVAVISVLEPSRNRQGHWLLPCGGSPRGLAALVAAPLCSSGQPARSWQEWLAVLAPLPPLLTGQANAGQANAGPLDPAQTNAAQPEPLYRYLLCLPAARRDPARISCWRRYPEGLGWQRRCGPMALPAFVARFSCSGAAAPSASGG